MTKKRENVVMFPGWQVRLEEKSIQLVNEKKFKEALEAIDELLYYNATNFNTNMLKLLCHVELEQFDEAIEFCESILVRGDIDYYAYLEFYLTILYQTNNFDELISIYEEEKRSHKIPDHLKKRFDELYRLSYQMNQQKKHRDSLQYLKELNKMIEENNIRGQWELINGLRKIGLTPPEEVIKLLSIENIHPVTKTSIFNWLKETNVNKPIKIEKFGEYKTINPDDVNKLGSHPIIKQTLAFLIDIEQENPSLYELIEDLLVRYTYVKYPLFYEEEEVSYVAEALIYIAKKNLSLPLKRKKLSSRATYFIDEINRCNELYLSIVDGT